MEYTRDSIEGQNHPQQQMQLPEFHPPSYYAENTGYHVYQEQQPLTSDLARQVKVNHKHKRHYEYPNPERYAINRPANYNTESKRMRKQEAKDARSRARRDTISRSAKPHINIQNLPGLPLNALPNNLNTGGTSRANKHLPSPDAAAVTNNESAAFYEQPGPAPGPPYIAVTKESLKSGGPGRKLTAPFPPPNNCCNYQGCVASGFFDEYEWQQHVDGHCYEFICRKDRCKTKKAIFVSQSNLNSHDREQHQGRRTKPLKNQIYCNVEGCNEDYLDPDGTQLRAHRERCHPGAAE